LTFRSCDLDLEPMTLLLSFDLDILKMHSYTKTEVYQGVQKLEPKQDLRADSVHAPYKKKQQSTMINQSEIKLISCAQL